MAFQAVENDKIVAFPDVLNRGFLLIQLSSELVKIGHLKPSAVTDGTAVRSDFF